MSLKGVCLRDGHQIERFNAKVEALRFSNAGHFVQREIEIDQAIAVRRIAAHRVTIS
jgi:hypothetical protein